MICVFGSFVLSDLRVLKLIGFGLAFAVFIDATVVRLRARAGDDGAARRPQLVVPEVARMAAARQRRRREARLRGRRGSHSGTGRRWVTQPSSEPTARASRHADWVVPAARCAYSASPSAS